MTEIMRSSDCGNSPKNKRAEDLAVALMTADSETVSTLLTDDVLWEFPGAGVITGIEAVRKALAAQEGRDLKRLAIEDVLTHGRKGAVCGRIEFGNGSRRFCHVFAFSSGKGSHICRITTYYVNL